LLEAFSDLSLKSGARLERLIYGTAQAFGNNLLEAAWITGKGHLPVAQEDIVQLASQLPLLTRHVARQDEKQGAPAPVPERGYASAGIDFLILDHAHTAHELAAASQNPSDGHKVGDDLCVQAVSVTEEQLQELGKRSLRLPFLL
jgi:hypothetical protein